ncbi:thermonuclease family protein, partial [Mesorhizobium sp. M2D.F.Ca.ET.223.01.1.1]
MAALVVAGGRVVKGHESVITVDQIDPIADALPTAGSETLSASGADTPPEEPMTSAIPAPAAPQAPNPVVHSRAIDPDVVAPP